MTAAHPSDREVSIVCGIHGIYRFDGLSVEPGILSAMGDRTRHRGPTTKAAMSTAPAGSPCAACRSSTSPVATSRLSNADETLWLVCNGEIYNFRELRSELQEKGYRFKTGSDCEVLLHLYDAEGDDFVHRLNGMFDFALWDARRRRLLIGRDRLGVKPLYVLQDWQRLAFASRSQGAAGVARGQRRTRPRGRRRLPAPRLRRRARLHLQGNPQAAAGHPAGRRGWSGARVALLAPARALTPGVSESEWSERVRVQLDESVRMQMVSDVPIGAFLSGGVDSSAVVG
jgi:asparagine synthase (glutamine-hydrolysing)